MNPVTPLPRHCEAAHPVLPCNDRRGICLFDLFLILLVLLAGAAFYFSFVKPVKFSHLIKREGVFRYAEVEILLPDDLSWLGEVMTVGEEARDVYGKLEWKIAGFGAEKLGGKETAKLTAKLLIVEDSSGVLRYGKYTLVLGSRIILINDRYFIEGRVRAVRVLEEAVPS